MARARPRQTVPTNFTIAEYDRTFGAWRPWVHVADRLLVAATIIELHSGIDAGMRAKDPATRVALMEGSQVVAMLRGMAMENLLKALWSHAGKELVRDGAVQKIDTVPHHQLVQMAGKVLQLHDIQLTQGREEMLRELTDFIQIGRYPVLNKQPSGVGTSTVHMWSTDLHDTFDALVAEMRAKLPPLLWQEGDAR